MIYNLHASNLQAEIRDNAKKREEKERKNVILFCAYISEQNGGEGERVTSFPFNRNLDIYIYKEIYMYT